jgi:hypothetical protein
MISHPLLDVFQYCCQSRLVERHGISFRRPFGTFEPEDPLVPASPVECCQLFLFLALASGRDAVIG